MSLLKRLEKEKATLDCNQSNETVKFPQKQQDPFRELKVRIHKEVINILDDELKVKKGQKSDKNGESLNLRVEEVIGQVVDKEISGLSRLERQKVIREISDEVLGMGPIEPLLNDPEVTEVMVNGAKHVYVERFGKIEAAGVTFRDDAHVMHIIDKIVSPIGRRIDEATPMVDARLADGSRVNAIIPPLSLVGPVITIRKFSREPLTVHDLIRFGTITPKMTTFIEACVKGKLNIIISGGTGSGKTTTLNVLSSYIPSSERIVTIEDAAELQLKQDHVITLESRPPNLEGKGSISIRDLVRNSLRMRPDRIVVGEVRSGEALDMLQAMNTGHDGSLTTLHSNSPRDTISRLETMVLMAGMDLPIRAIREQIASAIDLIVHQSRLRDGNRKITYITEVVGMEGDVITLQDIFLFDSEGIDDRGRFRGQFRSTGVRPNFISKLKVAGVNLPDEIFF